MNRVLSARTAGFRFLVFVALALSLVVPGLQELASAQTAGSDILMPSGYQISQFATGFTAATAFDRAPNGDLYVVDSGSGFGFAPGTPPPNVKIWKVPAAGGAPVAVFDGD